MSQEQLELTLPRLRRTIQPVQLPPADFPVVTAEVELYFQRHCTIVSKGLTLEALPNDVMPVRSGFYLTIWVAHTGNYMELGWFDAATQKWWAQGGQEMLPSKFTLWVGVNEQLGRTRRILL